MIYTTGSLDCETQESYWLTVYATDRGVVPFSASIEVFIQVEDVNDNAPLTSEPVSTTVRHGELSKDVSVVRIQAKTRMFTTAQISVSCIVSLLGILRTSFPLIPTQVIKKLFFFFFCSMKKQKNS